MTISGIAISRRAGERRGEEEQDDRAGGAHHDVAQRDRDGGADDLLDDGGVGGDPAGDFGRAIFLEEAGGEAQQIAVHREADVGDDPLADPADEIEADRGGDAPSRPPAAADIRTSGRYRRAPEKPRSMISLNA